MKDFLGEILDEILGLFCVIIGIVGFILYGIMILLGAILLIIPAFLLVALGMSLLPTVLIHIVCAFLGVSLFVFLNRLEDGICY